MIFTSLRIGMCGQDTVVLHICCSRDGEFSGSSAVDCRMKIWSADTTCACLDSFLLPCAVI